MKKVSLIAIIILSLAGIADSGYALKQHYAPPDISSCDVNETISCTAVNQSSYSEVFGLPVAGIGIAGYVTMGLLAGAALSRKSSASVILKLLAAMALAALAVSLYLTFIELFVLHAVCPLCVLSLLLIITTSAIAVRVQMLNARGKD
ncbi:MAG: vitamin K epoxide reductase family protein [Thermoleophilia bacterium]